MHYIVLLQCNRTGFLPRVLKKKNHASISIYSLFEMITDISIPLLIKHNP